MISQTQASRPFKLGMHTYTLHLSGLGESWGFQSEGKTHAFEKVINLDRLMDLCVEEGIEVIHMTLVDLDNDLSDEHLAAVRAKAERLGLDLELKFSKYARMTPIKTLGDFPATHAHGHKYFDTDAFFLVRWIGTWRASSGCDDWRFQLCQNLAVSFYPLLPLRGWRIHK